MRIIDKQHDFYDYLQDSTDTLVFDRRGSYVLTKEYIISCIEHSYYYNDRDSIVFLTIQSGATFWLVLVHIIRGNSQKNNIRVYNNIIDYNVELLTTWKDYTKNNRLFRIEIISIHGLYRLYKYKKHEVELDVIKKNINTIKESIERNNFKVNFVVNYGLSTKEENKVRVTNGSNLPLFKASGLPAIIDPVEMFCSIEEYFSIEKTNSETTEAKGVTDSDKIIMHGFDVKQSFRGKQGRVEK